MLYDIAVQYFGGTNLLRTFKALKKNSKEQKESNMVTKLQQENNAFNEWLWRFSMNNASEWMK